MRSLRKILITTLFLTAPYSNLLGQIPPGYYDPAMGLDGDTLRFELSKIIDGHQVQSYSSLWNHFWNTDRKPDSTVWDMYSDDPAGIPHYAYNFFTDQCGNYSGEGDCYNREHSFPRSWFGDQSPMNTDLFHLYPTDGYTNGQRGNLAYGETNNPNWTSQNGSKRGSSSVSGYSGTVFEPIDEYKGDFARTYFYMLTRYYSQISNWNSDMLSGDDFTNWAADMLMDWHRADTVSVKENDRNNEVYGIQNNRNPFIDHPAYAELIWGDSTIPGDTSTTFLNEFEEKEEAQFTYQDGQFRVKGAELQVEFLVQIFDRVGRRVEEFLISEGEQKYLALKEGIYFVQLLGKDQKYSVKLRVN